MHHFKSKSPKFFWGGSTAPPQPSPDPTPGRERDTPSPSPTSKNLALPLLTDGDSQVGPLRALVQYLQKFLENRHVFIEVNHGMMRSYKLGADVTGSLRSKDSFDNLLWSTRSERDWQKKK